MTGNRHGTPRQKSSRARRVTGSSGVRVLALVALFPIGLPDPSPLFVGCGSCAAESTILATSAIPNGAKEKCQTQRDCPANHFCHPREKACWEIPRPREQACSVSESDLDCAIFCQAEVAAGCRAQMTLSECTSICERLNATDECPESGALADCVGPSPMFVCNERGASIPLDCVAELECVNRCLRGERQPPPSTSGQETPAAPAPEGLEHGQSDEEVRQHERPRPSPPQPETVPP